jgi:hypothetical protein
MTLQPILQSVFVVVVGGGTEAVATDDIACLAASCCSGVFDGPLSEDFVRAITQSACRPTLQQVSKFASTWAQGSFSVKARGSSSVAECHR